MEQQRSQRKTDVQDVQLSSEQPFQEEQTQEKELEVKQKKLEVLENQSTDINKIQMNLADVHADIDTLMTVQQEEQQVKPLYSLQLQRTSSFRSLLGDASFYGVVKAKPYKMAILLQVMVWVWFWINIIIYLCDVYTYYVLIPLGCFYLGYLFESFTDKINSYLWNIERTMSFSTHLKQVQSEKPSIKWKVNAFHYQENKARPKVKPRLVESNVQHTHFYYTDCKDLSEPIEEITRQGVVRVHFDVQVVCSSKKTQKLYTKKKKEFLLANKTDEKIKFEEEIILPSFKEFILAVKEGNRIPC